jgi:hypothetical protein
LDSSACHPKFLRQNASILIHTQGMEQKFGGRTPPCHAADSL